MTAETRLTEERLVQEYLPLGCQKWPAKQNDAVLDDVVTGRALKPESKRISARLSVRKGRGFMLFRGRTKQKSFTKKPSAPIKIFQYL